MPNYRLSIERDKQIQEIDWSSILDKEYQELTHDLSVIDRLTTRAENSEELKKFLNSRGVLNEIRGNLCIMYKSCGEDKKLVYGIAYKKDKDFLKPSTISNYICERIDACDIEFLHRLINKYKNTRIHDNDIIILNNYIEAIVNNRVTDTKKNDVKEIMQRFVRKEVYSYNSKTKSYIVDKHGNVVLKYRSLRELGRLCSNYYNKEEKVLEDSIDGTIKIKKLDPKQFPGQISMEEYLKEK